MNRQAGSREKRRAGVRWYPHVASTLALALAVTGGAFATAALVGKDGEITGCVKKRGGDKGKVRIVSKKCKRSEREVVWQQTGPAGIDGPAGPEGPQGAEGPEGPPGPTASASDQDTSIASLVGTPTEILAASISTEVSSRIMAVASIEIDSNGGGDDRVACRISREAFGTAISNEYTTDIPDASFDRLTFAIAGATTQAAGTHTIRVFCTETSGATTYVQGNLTVTAVGL